MPPTLKTCENGLPPAGIRNFSLPFPLLPLGRDLLLMLLLALGAGVTRGGEQHPVAAEGSFLLCTFWLAHALALTGQVTRARDTLDRAAGYATELGLFAEQVDPATGHLLGNFPQAFSHLGLVNAAQALADAERLTVSPSS